MFNKVIFKEQPEIKEKVGALLVEAFPENERPPVSYFFESLKRKENTLLAFYQNETFIGFAYLTIYQDACYIFFLAVVKEYRNKGYGSKIIETIKNEYKGYVLLICYEEVDEKYDNYMQRKKRETFYHKLGFKDNGFISEEWGVRFQTAYIGPHKIEFSTYKEIFKIGFGVNADKYLKKAS